MESRVIRLLSIYNRSRNPCNSCIAADMDLYFYFLYDDSTLRTRRNFYYNEGAPSSWKQVRGLRLLQDGGFSSRAPTTFGTRIRRVIVTDPGM